MPHASPASSLSARDVWVVLLNTLVLAVGLLALWRLRMVVSWVLVALFLSLAFEPAVDWLTRHRFRRGWAVLCVLLAFLGLVGTMVGTMAPLVIAQAQELFARLPEFLGRLEDSRPVRWAEQHFQLVDKVQAALRGLPEGLTQPALDAARSVLVGLTGGVSILVLTVFMLLFGGEVLEQGSHWFSPERREHLWGLLGRIRKVVGGYVAGIFLVASVGGLVMGTTLAILGVPYFLPLGLVMIALGVVPFVGSTLGAVLLVGLTFATTGVRGGLICAGVYLVYQQVENNVLQPIVQRRTLRMNPLLVALALLVGTAGAGILGALLALPMAGVLQVLLQDVYARRHAHRRRQSAADAERRAVRPRAPGAATSATPPPA